MKRLIILLFVAGLVTGFSAMAANVTLTMGVNGQGTTNPTVGPHTYTKGTSVVCTAYPADGWSFVNWTGSVTTTANPYTIKMNSNKTLTANFTYNGPPMYTLTTSVSGRGTVTPAGTTQYVSGTVVNVSATPADQYSVFNHWEGALSGSTNPTTILMDGNKSVTGVFVELPNPTTALKDFVNAPDANYAWSQYASEGALFYTNYFIDMTSQQWRTAQEVDRPIWQHYMIVTVGWFTGNTAIILIDGGSNGGAPPTTGDSAIGMASFSSGFPVIDLKQVPNEPLMFADEPGVYRSEDDILAYSFDKYMLTGDTTWNGHLPMVKASIRGMDAAQASRGFADFVVVGASKRGWTTWLTAATDDPRIIGFCPIVIPILNVEAQMDHHWESYGFYSSAVDPYAAFDLFCRLKEPGADVWMLIEDPYTYLFNGRSPVIANKPKLLINASGDQFFMPDSLQYYWSDIPGPGTKHVRIIPNASHGMEEGDSFTQALNTALAWAGKVDDGAQQPVYNWNVAPDNSITVTCGSTPSGGAVLWQATNPTARDFRVETIGTVWTSTPLTNQGNNTFIGYCPPPAQGWTAFFVQVDFGNNEIYTSEIRINPDTLPYAGTHCLP